jgi:hypothetical protein
MPLLLGKGNSTAPDCRYPFYIGTIVMARIGSYQSCIISAEVGMTDANSTFLSCGAHALTLILPYTLISWKEEVDILKLSPPYPLFKKEGEQILFRWHSNHSTALSRRERFVL